MEQSSPARRGDNRLDGGGAPASIANAEDAEAGMKQRSEVFRESGGELYMGAGGREHD